MTAAIGSERGRRARPGALIAHAVTTLIGAGFFFGSFQYDLYRAEEQIGPAFLPRYASVLLVILGLLLVIQEIRGRSELSGDSGVDEARVITRPMVIKLLTVFGLITVALLLVPFLGLILSLMLLIPALAIGVEKMPVVPSLLFAAGAGIVAYLVFIVSLQVPLPMGVLEGIF